MDFGIFDYCFGFLVAVNIGLNKFQRMPLLLRSPRPCQKKASERHKTVQFALFANLFQKQQKFGKKSSKIRPIMPVHFQNQSSKLESNEETILNTNQPVQTNQPRSKKTFETRLSTTVLFILDAIDPTIFILNTDGFLNRNRLKLCASLKIHNRS